MREERDALGIKLHREVVLWSYQEGVRERVLTLDDVLTNPDFMTFNHRGVALRRRLDAINKIQ